MYLSFDWPNDVMCVAQLLIAPWTPWPGSLRVTQNEYFSLSTHQVIFTSCIL